MEVIGKYFKWSGCAYSITQLVAEKSLCYKVTCFSFRDRALLCCFRRLFVNASIKLQQLTAQGVKAAT